MSFQSKKEHEQRIEQQCQAIMKSTHIRNKIVVLCEGDTPTQGLRTVIGYQQLQKRPDADFYTACIPSSWTQKNRNFFPVVAEEMSWILTLSY